MLCYGSLFVILSANLASFDLLTNTSLDILIIINFIESCRGKKEKRNDDNATVEYTVSFEGFRSVETKGLSF